MSTRTLGGKRLRYDAYCFRLSEGWPVIYQHPRPQHIPRARGPSAFAFAGAGARSITKTVAPVLTSIINPYMMFGASFDAYYGYDEDGFEGNDTPVDFLRPDGDVEGKDIQWCLDNNFFQIHDGRNHGDYPLWSGPWYYKDHPEERSMHRRRLKDTEAIRSGKNSRHRGGVDVGSAFGGQETAAEKAMEEAFCAMLQNEMQLYGMVGRDLSDERAHESAEALGSQFSSLKLNANATKKSYKPSAKPAQRKQHTCKQCGKPFRTMLLAMDHMRKCCPDKLADKLATSKQAKYFAVDTCTYECMLCHEEYSEENECLGHFESCPSYYEFRSVEPDTFIKPKSRRRFPCKKCGKEYAKWNKCLEHMGSCCPDVLFK